MLLPRLPALLSLLTSTAYAYKNASPFFVLSSDPLAEDAPLNRAQIALAEDIENRLIETFSKCEQQRYYIFSQPSVTADDIRNDQMPRLQSLFEGVDETKFVGIPDVVDDGRLSAEDVKERLTVACEGMGKRKTDWTGSMSNDEYGIIHAQLPEVPSDSKERAKTMKHVDKSLFETAESVLKKDSSAVLIYISKPPPSTTPPTQEGGPYEMDDPYPSGLHTDLKRDLSHHARQSDEDDHMQDGLPLFEKYQFLSPPIFMGLSVSILLVLILSVGLRAICGLEVSYMAFSKEMGPQAQKGKQQ